MMKKLFALLVLVFTCQVAFCQTYDELINNYKDKCYAEYNVMNKELISTTFTDADAQTKAVLKNVDCMKMLEFKQCDETIKKDFLTQAKKLEGKYNKYIDVNEDGDTIIIFFDGDEELTKAIIIVLVNSKECDMLVVEGKLSLMQLSYFLDFMGGTED